MGRIIDRRRVMSGKSLPYDAEIEYLETNGTQWIDTGIAAQDPMEGRIIFEKLSKNGANTSIFGCREYPANDRFYFAYDYYNTLMLGYRDKYSFSSFNLKNGKADVYTVLHVDHQQLTCNDTIIANTYSSQSGRMSCNVMIFNIHGNKKPAMIEPYRLYQASLYTMGVPLWDSIPVRIGTTGYMYDKVSGQLFGNAGTGAFILGPDK